MTSSEVFQGENNKGKNEHAESNSIKCQTSNGKFQAIIPIKISDVLKRDFEVLNSPLSESKGDVFEQVRDGWQLSHGVDPERSQISSKSCAWT